MSMQSEERYFEIRLFSETLSLISFVNWTTFPLYVGEKWTSSQGVNCWIFLDMFNLWVSPELKSIMIF